MKTGIIALIALILMVLAVRDILKRRLKLLAFNLVWLAVVVLIPIVGPVLYFMLHEGMDANRPRKFDPKFR